jgi:hypothetical protein
MDDKDLEKQLESFTKNSEVYNHILEENIAYAKKNGTSLKDAKEATLRSIKAIDEASKMYKRSATDIGASLKKLEESFKDQELTSEDLEEQLGRLRNEVNRTTDQSAKQRLIAQKSYLEEQVVRKKFVDSMETAFGQQFGAVVGGLTNAITSAGKSAMSGAGGLQVAGELMTAGIDIANKSVQAGAKGISDTGAAMMNMGGKAKLAGLGLTALGAVVGGASAALSELAKSGIQMMIRETQKTIDTFRTVSQSGALFSNGMMGMRKSADDAGMSLEDFSKVASTNKEAFASLGLGVSGGMQKMSKSMAAGGEEMRKQLFGLGYSMEDQGNMMATVMSTMAGPSGKLKASDQEVASRTKQYAQNLSLLSALTGEDIKSKEAAIKKENENLAFQQKLDGMSEKERLDLQQSMAGMSEIQRKALRERMVYGTVVSADVNIAEAQNDALKQSNERIAQLQKTGELNVRSTLKTQAEFGPAIQKTTMEAQAFGAATNLIGGEAGNAARMMMEQSQLSAKLSGKSIEEQEKILAEQVANAKKDPMVEVQEEARKFGKEMDKLVTDNLPLFGRALGETMGIARQGIEAFRDFVHGVTKEPTWTEKIIAGIGALTAAIPGLITAISLIKAAIDWFKGQSGGGGGVDTPDGKGGKGGPGKPGLGGKALNLGKNLVKGGATAVLGMAGEYAGDKLKESGYQTAGTAVGIAGKTASYAGTGAMIGSFVPGIGNVVGGVIGGGIGLGMGIFDAMKEDDKRLARNWAYSVLTGQNEFDKIPDGIKGAVVELLKNPPPEFMSDPRSQQNIGNLKSKIDSYKSPEMQTGGYQEYASGGIASGPRSGYSATLHGTEAVVPLPDGKSIPVQFDTAALAERIGAALSTAMGSMQGSANSELVEVMQQQLSKHQEMIETLKESLDVNQRMLNHAYS